MRKAGRRGRVNRVFSEKKEKKVEFHDNLATVIQPSSGAIAPMITGVRPFGLPHRVLSTTDPHLLSLSGGAALNPGPYVFCLCDFRSM